MKEYIEEAIQKIGTEDLVLYFPDAGAAKRYSDLFSLYQFVALTLLSIQNLSLYLVVICPSLLE